MKAILPLFVLVALGMISSSLGHDSGTGEDHPHYDQSARPPEFFLGQANAPQKRTPLSGWWLVGLMKRSWQRVTEHDQR